MKLLLLFPAIISFLALSHTRSMEDVDHVSFLMSVIFIATLAFYMRHALKLHLHFSTSTSSAFTKSKSSVEESSESLDLLIVLWLQKHLTSPNMDILARFFHMVITEGWRRNASDGSVPSSRAMMCLNRSWTWARQCDQIFLTTMDSRALCASLTMANGFRRTLCLC